MKIKVVTKEDQEETEIVITCKEANADIRRVVATLQAMDKQIACFYENQTYLIEAYHILYFETVEKRTFAYTSDKMYETPLRLYELEERLLDSEFFRAGKSMIVNFNQIKSLRPDIDGKFLVTMNNNENVFVSRQYAVSIKQKLGVLK